MILDSSTLKIMALSNSAFDLVDLTLPLATATIDGGAVDFEVLGGFEPQMGDVFDLIVADTVDITTLPSLNIVTPFPFASFAILELGTEDGQLGLGAQSLRLTILPEPAALGLLALGAIVLCGRRR